MASTMKTLLLKHTRYYSSRPISQARGQRFRRRNTDLRICENI
jgi:hypothetical protein